VVKRIKPLDLFLRIQEKAYVCGKETDSLMTQKQNTEFGMTLTFVLLALTWWWRLPLLLPAMTALLTSLLCPIVYTPVAWAWMRLGKGLESGMSKLVLCMIFFLVVTPVGRIRRLMGKDGMRLRDFANSRDSVFEDRTHGYQKEDLEKQF
jgi:hypothetical protein